MLHLPDKFKLVKFFKGAQMVAVISEYETLEDSFHYARDVIQQNTDKVISVIMEFQGRVLEVNESTPTLADFLWSINPQETSDDNTQDEMAD